MFSRCAPASLLILPLVAAFASDERPRDHQRSYGVPAYVLEMPATVESILVAEASTATLYRFSNENGRAVLKARSHLSVGLNGVGKQRAWDRRTPLGVYFLTEELDTQTLDPKYGELAFVMDYPNAWDRYRERTGDGIWLHGVHPDTPVRPARDTDGCLALPNDALLALKPWLQLHDTPVVVARRALWAEAGDLAERRDRLKQALGAWADSLAAGNLYDYMQLYADEFRSRGMDRDGWAKFRMQSFDAKRFDEVELDNLLLVMDPSEPDLYLARFDMRLSGAAGSVSLRKRLYWRQSAAGLLIVAEDAG